MNDEYKKMLERFEQICQNAKKELCAKKEKQQEIERLKELNDGLTTEIQKELKGKLKLLDEIERLNNRIDKAIEYIENSDKYDFSKCELLDILKGEKDEHTGMV